MKSIFEDPNRSINDALSRSISPQWCYINTDKNIAGFGEVGWDTASNGSEIKYFGLMPDLIGRSLGPYFLNTIINIAWKRNPIRLRVNTCDLDHPSALHVYQKSGFNILEEVIERVPDPTLVGLPHPPSHEERQKYRGKRY
jgi:GNAT superfamily N-acetyltransferase